jgi:pectin methylesterase-like acyl-CoA thioesterase
MSTGNSPRLLLTSCSGVALTGFQDTLLAQQGYQLYSKCLIQGATDFIFGQTASAWFEKIDLRVVAASVGYITGILFIPRYQAQVLTPNSQRS